MDFNVEFLVLASLKAQPTFQHSGPGAGAPGEGRPRPALPRPAPRDV